MPTPASLPGKSHGERSLVDCSPWGHKEPGTTEQLTFRALNKETKSQKAVTQSYIFSHLEIWTFIQQRITNQCCFFLILSQPWKLRFSRDPVEIPQAPAISSQIGGNHMERRGEQSVSTSCRKRIWKQHRCKLNKVIPFFSISHVSS